MEQLFKRLSQYSDIDRAAFAPLKQASSLSAVYEPGDEIILEGDTITSMFVVESGWAIRYRILDDGRRQILNFMLPGDCFDVMSIIQSQADHSVSAATKMQFRRIKTSEFLRIMKSDQILASAFWRVAIQEEAILREQITRVGRRSATERLAHLILELNERASIAEGTSSDFLRLPIPQSLFADALSLSVVHISRTLTKLRTMGMIQTTSEGVEILDRHKLKKISGFEPNYLHMPHWKLTA